MEWATTILTVPPALYAIRELLTNASIDSSHISDIEKALEDFASGHVWLSEGKKVHDDLTRLVAGYGGLEIEAGKAFNSGNFDPGQFKFDDLQQQWKFFYNSQVLPLRSTCEAVTTIEAHGGRLEFDRQGRPVSGPPWLQELFLLIQSIDQTFQNHKTSDSSTSEFLAREVNRIDRVARVALQGANMLLIDQLTEMSKCLSQLESQVKN